MMKTLFKNKQIQLVILIIFISLFLHVLPQFLSSLSNLPYPFRQTSKLTWESDISFLPPGRYYVSLGRPVATCALLLDSITIDSNSSLVGEIKNHLFLGGGFVISSPKISHPKKILLKCSPQGGFPTKIDHPPILANFHMGLLIQWLRAIGIIAGPIFSFTLVLSLIFINDSIKRTLNINLPFYLFGIISFFYSLSLLHLGSFFLDGTTYTNVHILLRILFSFCFIYLCGTYCRQRRFLLVSHLIILLISLYCVSHTPHSLYYVYYYSYPLFPLSTAVLSYDLIRQSNNTRFSVSLGTISAVWSLFQLRDMIYLWFFTGPFLAPSMIMALMVCLTYSQYQEVIQIERKNERLRTDLEIATTMTNFATQVAHDIRSPLALLTTLKTDETLSHETRQALQLGVARLQSITEQVLSKNRKYLASISSSTPSSFNPSSEALIPTQITDLLVKIIEEKRRIINDKESIQLSFELPQTDKKILLQLQPIEFVRLISNILNNSIESIDRSGIISIRLLTEGARTTIAITDNGKGIPTCIMDRIGSLGMTYGKTNGNGLGLYHAKKTVEYWGGTFKVSSIEGKGTTILISLQNAA